MRTTFVSFIKNRSLLTALAYEMLQREWIKIASRAEALDAARALLAEADDSPDEADQFLEQACTTGVLSCQNDVVQWQSAKTQAYLAASRLYTQYGKHKLHDKQQAAAWLCEKAAQKHWRKPMLLMSYQVENAEQAAHIAKQVAEPAPALAAWYHGRVQDGFFDTPRFERRFLGEIAWPLGDMRFWRRALEDWDADTRSQAALVLGAARISKAHDPLLGALDDGDEQVRARAAWALGRLADDAASAKLSPLLHDRSRRARFQARRALTRIQGQEQAPTRPLSPGLKILVSDDFPDMLDLYELILKEKASVLCSPGGQQTLELARRQQPDLIATDLRNVHMPGIDLVFHLRNDEATREIPIVIASVHPQHYLGFFGGADAFLRVPFGPEELLSLVDEILLES